MKKCISVLLLSALLLSFAGCSGPKTNSENEELKDNVFVYEEKELSSSVTARNEYYVSPDGNDDNDGSEVNPFKTVQCAMSAVNKFKEETNSDMAIILKGTNYLYDTWHISGSDSLPNGRVLTIKSAVGENAAISGGRRVSNWKEVTVNGLKMYKAKISDESAVRYFLVNGCARPMAATFAGRNSAYKMSDKATWTWGEKYKSIKITKNVDLTKIKNPSQLEIGMICEWHTNIFKTDSIEGNDTVKLLQPYANWLISPASVGGLDPGGYWYPNPKHDLWLQNDVSLIDERGEWCFDKSEKCLYYYPYEGENMNEALCEASRLDKVIELEGGLNEKRIFTRVENIRFENLSFELGGFDMLEKQGIGIVQGQTYYSGATVISGSSEPNSVQPVPQSVYDGNITVKKAKNISFDSCYFTGMSRGALHFDAGTQNSEIIGCVFENLGDSAIVISNAGQVSSADSEQVINITVKNNVIRNTGNVNMTASGICGYYGNGIEISHNDIYNCTQSGISLGWGWYIMDLAFVGNNKITDNRVGFYGHTVRDVGGIYVLGKSRSGEISGNYVYDQRNAYAGLYIDEGSCNWLIKNNFVDNCWGEYDDITWFRFNGFANGPGGSTTVYLNTLTDNFFTNYAEADNGNTAEGYANVISNNNPAANSATLGDISGKSYYPNANPNWAAGAKAIFDNAGTEAEYDRIYNKLRSER